MKSKATFLILFLALLPTFSLADSDLDLKKESLVKELVQKEPDSEEHHYDYAMILYKQDRMDEAKQQLTQLLALNPNHDDGKSMLKSIEQLQGITDAQHVVN